MNKKLSILLTEIRCLMIRFQNNVWPEIAKKIFPHIWINPPKPPNGGICPKCGKPYRVGAYKDEGWIFYWVCDNRCDDDLFIVDWFPFLNEWCNSHELSAHDVEIL